MRKKGKITWGPGQGPTKIEVLPSYISPPPVESAELQDIWRSLKLGDILLLNIPMYVDPYSQGFPYPVLYGTKGTHGAITTNQIVIYMGETPVEMRTASTRVLTRNYVTVLFNGSRYLIHDLNHFRLLTAT